MPFELKLAPDEFLARVRGWGTEDFTTTLAGLQGISEDPRLGSGAPILLDVRDLEYLATPPEVSSFAAPGAMPLFTNRRVAILTRRGAQFGVSRAFATKVEGSGAVVEVFAEEELALSWLRGER